MCTTVAEFGRNPGVQISRIEHGTSTWLGVWLKSDAGIGSDQRERDFASQSIQSRRQSLMRNGMSAQTVESGTGGPAGVLSDSYRFPGVWPQVKQHTGESIFGLLLVNKEST
mmetsp:Transcript_42725/g.51874  ORF Transcript_42725/g.51874 Transcript_42725/m.51874 type:complete len:112 (-) Transcript_42725:365-700(-)